MEDKIDGTIKCSMEKNQESSQVSMGSASRYFISTIYEIFSSQIPPVRSTPHNTYPTDLKAHWQVKKRSLSNNLVF